MNLSFSPCGSILRVAIIDVVAEKQKPLDKSATTAARSKAQKPRLAVNLHVLLLRLSSTQAVRHPPKLFATASYQLRHSCAEAFRRVLPFAFVWGANDLYLTVSDSYLHLYRVVLPEVESQRVTVATEQVQEGKTAGAGAAKKIEPKFSILVPREMILLPRSAHNRSVQFFPARGGSAKATVIIGPRHCRNPTPPIGVYLTERDLKGWVEYSAASEGGTRGPQKRLEGQFEEPWEETDCILIPFDGY